MSLRHNGSAEMNEDLNMEMPEVGDRAPDFELKDTTGALVKLSELRGKKVVLYFYPNDDTRGCTIEACSFRDNLARVTKYGAVVYGVSANDVESHQKFTDKFQLNFPLLADTEKKTVQEYGVWVEKNNYGIKSMGIKRTTFLIDEQGKIAHVWPTVKPEEHVDEVIAVLMSPGLSSAVTAAP